MTHTPTPWRCKKIFQGSHTPKRSDILGPPGHREVAAVYWHVMDSDQPTAIANADLIVRAVNAHAALVAALRKIVALDEGDCEKYVAKADAIALDVLVQLGLDGK